MLSALRTSRGKIPGSRALWLGTRPASADHPFQRALDGHGVGFALCYQAPKDAAPFRASTWRRANPSLPHMPDLGKRDPAGVGRRQARPCGAGQFPGAEA